MTAAAVAGIALLGLLFWDVVLTLLAPYGSHGGPLHRRQNQMIWTLFRTVGARMPEGIRSRFLGLAGPVAAVWTIASWAGCLVVGFALLYLTRLDSLVPIEAASGLTWVDAVYYSGYVASTLGLGDLVTTSPSLRIVTVVEAMGGFGLFAMSTTYVLAITRQVAETGDLALDIASFRRTVADRGNRADDAAWSATLTRRAESWASTLLRATDAHARFPLVHYFRPLDANRSLLLQMGWLLSLARARSLPGDSSDVALGPASADLLFESVVRYLLVVNRGCVPGSFDPLRRDDASTERLHARLLRHMSYDIQSASEDEEPSGGSTSAD